MPDVLKEHAHLIMHSPRTTKIGWKVIATLTQLSTFHTQIEPWFPSWQSGTIVPLPWMKMLNIYPRLYQRSSFLPPPKKGDNVDYNIYVQKSKNTNMENAIEERAEKCSAYDKNCLPKVFRQLTKTSSLLSQIWSFFSNSYLMRSNLPKLRQSSPWWRESLRY